jgi:SAM-dependent methyltransferase
VVLLCGAHRGAGGPCVASRPGKNKRVHEILHSLGPGQRVLDLGSNTGSFPSSVGPFTVIRADLDQPSSAAVNFARADAAHLPFADHAFDAIISNHSLEHFADLAGSLAEMGRVLKPTGALYIAVPDASTFCDRLYRWLARGGGHLNAFTSAPALAGTIERATHLRHIDTRTLCTSLSYLNRNNRKVAGPRRLLAVGGGSEISLHIFTYFARLSDRLFGTRLSVYGWALYFGSFNVPIDIDVWTNVCIRCGSGAPSEWLRELNLVHRRFLLRVYRCQNCGTTNLFSEDRRFPHFAVRSAANPP